MLAAFDVALLSICAVLATLGVAVTGFGHAIIFLFVYQIMALSGYDGIDIKFAIFTQMLALLAAQPLLLWKASVRKHATRPFVLLFIPVTVLSTPLGQYTASHLDVRVLKAVGGVIVTLIGAFEVYKNRASIVELLGRTKADTATNSVIVPIVRTSLVAFDSRVPMNRLSRGISASFRPLPSYFLSNKVYDPASPVFFMIGSQRSGSNWLRTILNEREDLAGPHPPHILRDFVPILAKFGDVSHPEQLG